MQSRRHSLFEATLNTASGFAITMLVQAAIYPLFDLHTNTSTNFYIACIFTVTSIARSYLFRRVFNWLHMKGLLK